MSGCSGGHSHETGDVNHPLAAQTASQEDADEISHLEKVCDSFRHFATFAKCARSGQARRVQALPASQRQFLPPSMIPGTPEAEARQHLYHEAEIRNQFFFDSMLRYAQMPNSQDLVREQQTGKPMKWSSDDDISKVSSVLKSLARDWSTDGQAERESCYRPLLDAVKTYLPGQSSNPPSRIVVPGAGVGRLAAELLSLGYEVQGNEFSLHMLLASDFLLNSGSSPSRQYEISPWMSETKNICKTEDPVRSIFIPDVDPFELCTRGGHGTEYAPEFSMAAGEFVSIYSNPQEYGKWNGVVSCFFLDTAPSMVEYLQVIYDMLADNGYLINIGPLLFHWSGPSTRPDDMNPKDFLTKHSHLDRRYMESIDMTWDDVREIMIRIGFSIEEEKTNVPCRYTANEKSFMNTDYRCVFFVAKKCHSAQNLNHDIV